MRAASFLVLAAALFAPPSASPGQSRARSAPPEPPEPKSLFAQSAVELLDREFPSPDISFLLVDAHSGVLLASRWEDAGRPIPLGSLVKPFTALAYGAQHGYRFPGHICRGEASGCWQLRPHGPLDLRSAIAYSCNSYFRVLADALTGEQMLAVTEQFGLEAPAAGLSGPPLMGLGNDWPIAPLHMAHAYLELIHRRDQPAVHDILTGMAQAASYGTGSSVGRALKHVDALVKTGTAPCSHPRAAPGDGFSVALVPAAQPEILLMVRVHGVPGSTASVTAARMLARLTE
jgi:hypothetical protein